MYIRMSWLSDQFHPLPWITSKNRSFLLMLAWKGVEMEGSVRGELCTPTSFLTRVNGVCKNIHGLFNHKTRRIPVLPPYLV